MQLRQRGAQHLVEKEDSCFKIYIKPVHLTNERSLQTSEKECVQCNVCMCLKVHSQIW